MSPGLSFERFSYEKPSLSSAPGRKFSVSTSAFLRSRSTSSRPSGFCRSTARLFLLRLNTGKKPAPAASRRRVLSPASGSTLITSAPRSASTSPQDRPITMCADPTTRTSSSGSTKSFGQPGERGVPVDRFFRNAFDENLTGLKQLLQRNPGADAHALEHEDEVLGDHVAARARRERAAAEATHRAVEMAHAFLVGGERIGEAEAARVVKVRAFELVADFGFDSFEEPSYLSWVRIPHRVGQRDAVAELGKLRGYAHHIVLRNAALQRAAESGRHRTLDLDAGMRMLRAFADLLDHLVRR